MSDAKLPPTDGINLMTADLLSPLKPDSFQPVPAMDLEVRSLGFGALSDGAVGMQVFRANGQPSTAEPVWHMHELQAHVGYVIKGWALYEFEGLGEVRVEAGTAICHRPRSRMRILDRSADFEGVWVKCPADDKVTAFFFDPNARAYSTMEIQNSGA